MILRKGKEKHPKFPYWDHVAVEHGNNLFPLRVISWADMADVRKIAQQKFGLLPEGLPCYVAEDEAGYLYFYPVPNVDFYLKPI